MRNPPILTEKDLPAMRVTVTATSYYQSVTVTKAELDAHAQDNWATRYLAEIRRRIDRPTFEEAHGCTREECWEHMERVALSDEPFTLFGGL